MANAKIQTFYTFERHEKKYLIDAGQTQKLLSHLHSYMEVDMYGRHTICTLYFDTEDYAVIRRCQERPQFREKLRLRSYGVPAADSTVYLELKKKFNGITYKRRAPFCLHELNQILDNISFSEENPHLDSGIARHSDQISGELGWYLAQQPLRKKVLICNDREAYVGKADPDLRITFDSNIRWRTNRLSLEDGDDGELLLDADSSLIEIKTKQALPLWLVKILSDLKIYPLSFSKYGTVYQQLLSRESNKLNKEVYPAEHVYRVQQKDTAQSKQEVLHHVI